MCFVFVVHKTKTIEKRDFTTLRSALFLSLDRIDTINDVSRYTR